MLAMTCCHTHADVIHMLTLCTRLPRSDRSDGLIDVLGQSQAAYSLKKSMVWSAGLVGRVSVTCLPPSLVNSAFQKCCPTYAAADANSIASHNGSCCCHRGHDLLHTWPRLMRHCKSCIFSFCEAAAQPRPALHLSDRRMPAVQDRQHASHIASTCMMPMYTCASTGM